MTRSRIILAATLASSMLALPALANEIEDNVGVKQLATLAVAGTLCGYRDEKLAYAFERFAMQTTGASSNEIYAYAKVYSFKIIDHLFDAGTQGEFCVNIWNGDW